MEIDVQLVSLELPIGQGCKISMDEGDMTPISSDYWLVPTNDPTKQKPGLSTSCLLRGAERVKSLLECDLIYKH